jgi:hypothetical protein
VAEPAVPWWRSPQGRCTLVGALLLLAVVGPIVQEYTAQTASRYPFTAAIAEGGTVSIEAYRPAVEGYPDRLEVDGELYSDKAPGQPVWAVPAYLAARAAGAEDPARLRTQGNLGAWAVTLWSSLLPAVALVAMMGFAVRERPGRAAVLAPLSLAFGTLLLPFSAQLYGHLLATALGFAAWLVVRDGRALGTRGAFLAGVLCGAAVIVEYPAGLLLLPITILVVRAAPAFLVPFALGGLPFAAALLAYQARVLGNPFSSSYSGKEVHSDASPLVTGAPDPVQAVEILVGSRGLLLFTPIVALAVAGLVVGHRERVLDRRDVLTCGGVALLYWMLQAGWVNPWGGEMPGPRYMITALPFLVIGAVVAWDRWPRPATVLTAISIASMTFPLITRHLVRDGSALVRSQLLSLDEQGVMPTIFTMAVGPVGWLFHAALVAGVLWWFVRELRCVDAPAPEPSAAATTR